MSSPNWKDFSLESVLEEQAVSAYLKELVFIN